MRRQGRKHLVMFSAATLLFATALSETAFAQRGRGGRGGGGRSIGRSGGIGRSIGRSGGIGRSIGRSGGIGRSVGRSGGIGRSIGRSGGIGRSIGSRSGGISRSGSIGRSIGRSGIGSSSRRSGGIGGITRGSGITRSRGSSGIGGITRSRGGIGGITRGSGIGGITRSRSNILGNRNLGRWSFDRNRGGTSSRSRGTGSGLNRGGIGSINRGGIGGISRGGIGGVNRGGKSRGGIGGINRGGIGRGGIGGSGRGGIGGINRGGIGRGGIGGINRGGIGRGGIGGINRGRRSDRFRNRWGNVGGVGFGRFGRRRSWGFYLAGGYRGWGLGFGYNPGSYFFDFSYARPFGGYYNPYCVAPTYFPTQYPVYDYSQPIVDSGTPSDTVADTMAAADEAFRSGQYKAALAYVDAAIKELPKNSGLHQFRSLILFAMAQYRDSAAAAHAALMGGAGWNWQTLRSFYPSKEAYTAHLRTLEAYRSKNRRDAGSRFLLGYHYMMLGHSDAAAGELLVAVELEPRDTLSSELLAAISKKTGKQYTPKAPDKAGPMFPKTPPVPPLPSDTPVQAKKPAIDPTGAFTGTWKTSQPDGTAVTLKLLPGGKFEWKASKGGRSTTLEGTFTVVKDQLKLTSSRGGQVLEGRLSSQTKDAFQWKLKWQDADEPGLTFKRQ